MRHHDAVLRCCRGAGFSIQLAAHAFSVMDAYIYGFVLQELTLPFDDSTDLEAVVDTMLLPYSPEEYPTSSRWRLSTSSSRATATATSSSGAST
jgi:hypothetical protein